MSQNLFDSLFPNELIIEYFVDRALDEENPVYSILVTERASGRLPLMSKRFLYQISSSFLENTIHTDSLFDAAQTEFLIKEFNKGYAKVFPRMLLEYIEYLQGGREPLKKGDLGQCIYYQTYEGF